MALDNVIAVGVGGQLLRRLGGRSGSVIGIREGKGVAGRGGLTAVLESLDDSVGQSPSISPVGSGSSCCCSAMIRSASCCQREARGGRCGDLTGDLMFRQPLRGAGGKCGRRYWRWVPRFVQARVHAVQRLRFVPMFWCNLLGAVFCDWVSLREGKGSRHCRECRRYPRSLRKQYRLWVVE